MSVNNRNHRNRVRGEFHHSAVLTERKVRWLRRMNDRGLCVRCAAKLIGVSYTAAWDAVNYNTWRHVS